jgi:hypothetical protein
VTAERAMEHRCGYVVMVAIDQFGLWRCFTPAWQPIPDCPKCGRLLTRRGSRAAVVPAT